MRSARCFLFLLVLGLAAAPALAVDGWHKSMKDGQEAQHKSGKPMLVVTAWKSGV